MTHRNRAFVGVLAVVSASMAVLIEGRGAPPRTREGRPDLQGVWSYATLTPLERPEEFAGKAFFTEAEASAFERRTLDVQNRDRRDGDGPSGRGPDGRTDLDRAYNQVWWEYGAKVVGTKRTSLIVDPPDGRIPALTPQAKRRLDALDAEARDEQLGTVRADSAQSRSLVDRCVVGLNAGPPFIPGAYNNRIQVVQGPQHVVFVMEMIHEPRVVPVDGRPPLAPSIRPYVGSSRGRWDGRTLVVATTNFLRETSFRGSSAAMRLEERFTRTGPDTLLYEFTVEDPATWTRPWTAVVPLHRVEEPVFEYACHEGNYALRNILAGVRAQERAR